MKVYFLRKEGEQFDTLLVNLKLTTWHNIEKSHDYMYIVYYTQVHGSYYEFGNCFAVKQTKRQGNAIFFNKRDSGPKVFLINIKIAIWNL